MSHENEVHFAKNIKRLALSKKMTLSELALKIGISKSTLHDYCNGVYPRSLRTISKIASFFGVSIHTLMSEKNISSLSINLTGDIEGEYSVVISKKTHNQDKTR